VSELSQPTFKVSPVGKIVVDKTPDGAKSPNLADALMIRFAPAAYQMKINAAVIGQIRSRAPMRIARW
jgi:hypothetical protein